MNNAHTANTIRMLCKEKGVSMKAFLKECEIRKGLIYSMETLDNTPSGDILEKIADYFDCSVDYLMGRTDNPEVNK